MSRKSRQKGVGKHKRYWKLIAAAEQKLASEKFSSAAELLQEAVGTAPELPEAWHKLGASLYYMGDMEQACESFKRAADLDDSNFNYINDLGGIYLGLARFDDAEYAFRRAMTIEPQSVEARYNLATCLLEQGKLEQAVPLLQFVISQSPELPEPKFNLALAFRKMGKPVQAVPWLEQVLSEALPMAQLELARCFRDARDWQKAKSAYSRIDKRLVTEAVAREFAEIIYLNGNAEEAITYLVKTRSRFPKTSQGLELLMADIYLNSGELEKAQELLEPLVAETGHEYFVGAANLLVRMQGSSETDTNLEKKLRNRLELSEDNAEESATLNFTLAKVLDNANAFGEAENYYIEANRICNERIRYDANKQETTVENTIQFFLGGKDRITKTDAGLESSGLEITPVFVVGLPRSGTTLVEQVLAAHSSIHSAGELGFFSNTAAKLSEMFELEEVYPNALGSLTIDDCQNLKNTYMSLLKRHNPGVPLITDKMPENFQHVGFIRLLFPQAPIIHVKREPADVAVSIFMQNFELGNRYAYAMENIAHYVVQYERLMTFWQTLEGAKIFDVRYENLVREPKTCSEELFAYLELPWEADSLAFYRNKTDVRTASNWQVRQPLYESSIGRSANYPKLKSMFDRHVAEQRSRYA